MNAEIGGFLRRLRERGRDSSGFARERGRHRRRKEVDTDERRPSRWTNVVMSAAETSLECALMEQLEIGGTSTCQPTNEDGSIEITSFSDIGESTTLHFQIIRLSKQIYAWIGYNSTKLGHLHAAASTRPSNTVSVSPIFGGTSDNTGSSIARRLVLRTGLNIILACNIPKNNPMIEAMAEKKLLEKLISLGYTQPR